LAACTTPTDPVLANSIVNGRFADLHIHLRLRQLLSGESAANDGIALPFFYLGVYLIKYSAGEAIKNWFLNVVLYEMCVAIAFGCSVGYAMRYALRFSEERNYIDKKNFLVFEIAFAVGSSLLLAEIDWIVLRFWNRLYVWYLLVHLNVCGWSRFLLGRLVYKRYRRSACPRSHRYACEHCLFYLFRSVYPLVVV
jgi:NhaP-type Na+/H+ or K+/H+ antiporter